VRPTRALLAAATLLLCAGIPARAELSQDGDLIVSFEGGLSPAALPRSIPAPVAVRVAGDVKSATGQQSKLPQLRRITVAINRAGHLFSRGLPVCHVSAIQPATEAAARRICGGAIVGGGRVVVQARLPTQPVSSVKASLLAFNGPTRHGHKLILAQVYSRRPPGAFVLTFTVRHRPGLFGTVLTTTLPASARSWAYLTHFGITLHRTYAYAGKRRSYVSAACAAPPGFGLAPFPFARATMTFADASRLSSTLVRSCRVRG
jgi:hypothetical protein